VVMRSLRAVIAALAICAIGTVIVLTHVSESPADRVSADTHRS
jgi:hypothetical protein